MYYQVITLQAWVVFSPGVRDTKPIVGPARPRAARPRLALSIQWSIVACTAFSPEQAEQKRDIAALIRAYFGIGRLMACSSRDRPWSQSELQRDIPPRRATPILQVPRNMPSCHGSCHDEWYAAAACSGGDDTASRKRLSVLVLRHKQSIVPRLLRFT